MTGRALREGFASLRGQRGARPWIALPPDRNADAAHLALGFIRVTL